jgi:hypothetical protein
MLSVTFFIVMLSVIMLCVLMLGPGCHYAECRYAECHYSECRDTVLNAVSESSGKIQIIDKMIHQWFI